MRQPRPSTPAQRGSHLPQRLLIGLLSAVLLGSLAKPAAAGAGQSGQSGPSSTPSLGEALGPSNADQLALVEHLRRAGALFYGAWWCPACFRQKSLFGQQAGERLPYVECDKTAEGRERCRAAGIEAYPTWVQGNRRVEGVLSLEELKRWSGFAPAPPTGAP